MEYARRIMRFESEASASGSLSGHRGAEAGRANTAYCPGVNAGSSHPSGATRKTARSGAVSIRCVTTAGFIGTAAATALVFAAGSIMAFLPRIPISRSHAQSRNTRMLDA